MKQTLEWNKEALLQSPLFVPLYPILADLEVDGFPTLQDCNALLDESGVILVYADAELAALLRNFKWQELFWQRRVQVGTGRFDRLRTGMGFYIHSDINLLRDSGARSGSARDPHILMCMLRSLRAGLPHPQTARYDFCRYVYLFGHGLYEKALQPYVGMTGQGLLLAVESAFFSWPLALRLAHLDNMLADYLAAPEHCRSTRDLSPVPLLGVPGWTACNCSETYYDNTAYFRPGRRG